MSTGNSWVDEQINAAAAILNNRWKNGERPVQPENDLSAPTQKYELRVKMLEDRCDTLERILKRARLM